MQGIITEAVSAAVSREMGALLVKHTDKEPKDKMVD